MPSVGIETLPTERDRRDGGEVSADGPHLVVAFECDRPLEPPTRHSLVEIDTVVVGRGTTRSAERMRQGNERCLVLRLPDPRMSSVHLRVVSVGGCRLLRDAGSRNGTVLNGKVQNAAPLADGDLFEAGQTLFLYREAMDGPSSLASLPDVGPYAGAAPGMETLLPGLAQRFVNLQRLAPSPLAVLLQAESGTGKELIARAIHQLSGRRGPFVAINCGAIPATLVETELFGYRKGAFSGAVDDRPGIIRSAEKGTLFLDEIADLPLSCQPAFLRALQEREVLPVGATRAVPVDVRLVSASHRSLEAMAAAGQFRSDLLARISGYTFSLPPLRERREDLGLLIAALLRRIAGERAAGVRFTAEAARALFSHRWSLNIRELANTLEAALLLAGDETIGLKHLSDPLRSSQADGPDPSSTTSNEPPALSPAEERQRQELLALLREHGFNVSAVARSMGKARTQVQRWMRRYRIVARDPDQ
jgi:sigma-54 dependent transcriptional regulator, acetoin dehydrogenase operon transcriptional activator AcoR